MSGFNIVKFDGSGGGGGGGSGDVTGPASSEDSEIALYDGLSGKVLKSDPTNNFIVTHGPARVQLGTIVDGKRIVIQPADTSTGTGKDTTVRAGGSPDAAGGNLELFAGSGGPNGEISIGNATQVNFNNIPLQNVINVSAGVAPSGQSITIQAADGDGYYTPGGNVNITPGGNSPGTVNLNGGTIVTGNIALYGSLGATGHVNTDDYIDVGTTLTVAGTTTLNDNVSISGSLTVDSSTAPAVSITGTSSQVISGSETIDWLIIKRFTESIIGNLDAPVADGGDDFIATGGTVTSGDFFAEYTVVENNNNKLTLAFDESPTPSNAGPGSLKFSLTLSDPAMNIEITENGTLVFGSGTAAPGDVLRIEYLAGTLLYKVNGSIVYTSSETPVYPVYVVAGYKGAGGFGSALTNAQQTHYVEQATNLTEWENPSGTVVASVQSNGQISGAILQVQNTADNGDVVTSTIQSSNVVPGTQDISWQNLVDFTQGPAGTLVSTPSAGNRFALGDVTIESGDYFAEVTINGNDNGIAFGFSADTNSNPGGGPFGGNLLFGYRIDANSLFDVGIYEGASTPVQAYATIGGRLPHVGVGDVARIEYSNGQVLYKVNNNIIYVSSNVPSYPAYVKFFFGGADGVTIITDSQQTVYTEQTANLTEWKNSGGDVLASVNVDGIDASIPIFVDATDSDFISFDTNVGSGNASPAIRVQSVSMGPTTVFTVDSDGTTTAPVVKTDQIFDTSLGAGLVVQTTAGNTTGGMEFNTGNATGASPSGTITTTTGTVTGAGNSGTITMYTGEAATGFSGGFDHSTGDVTTGSSGGQIFYTGSASSGAGTSGYIQLETGATLGSGVTGAVHLITGGSTSGPSGNINLTTGSAGTTRGDINLSADEINTTGDILPTATTTDSLGSNSKQFLEVYANIMRTSNSYRGTGSSVEVVAEPQTGGSQGGTASMQGGSSENADAGQISISGGTCSTLGNGGSVVISAGSADGDGNGGPVEIASGPVVGTGNSGDMFVYTGDAADGNSGGMSFIIGAASGTRGDITFDANLVSVASGVEINTTTGALLLPRLTSTQRDNLTAVNGMLIYNTTTNKFQGYENGAWANLI